MKYLDEQIIIRCNNRRTFTTGIYQYYVLNGNADIIFVGNIYLNAGIDTEYKDINVTDIIRTCKWDGRNYDYSNPKIFDYYSIEIYPNGTARDGNSVVFWGNSDEVTFAYRYPNHKQYLSNNLIWDEDDSYEKYIQVPLQGKMYKEVKDDSWYIKPVENGNMLYPHLPYCSSTNFMYPLVYVANKFDDTYAFSLDGALRYSTAPVIPADSLYQGDRKKGEVYAISMYDLFRDSVTTQEIGNISILKNNSRTAKGWVLDTFGDNMIKYYTQGNAYPTLHMGYCNGVINNILLQPIDVVTFDYDAEGAQAGKAQVVSHTVSGNNTREYMYFCWGNSDYIVISTKNTSFRDSNKSNNVTMTMNFSLTEPNILSIHINGMGTTTWYGTGETAMLKIYGDKLATVDMCPSRYYVLWQDRMGGFQVQPFGKTETYSEDIEATEYQDYTNKSYISNVSIQPKWKLNTNWIKQVYYPFYESIMVSPIIKIYDSEEDEVYDVVVEDRTYQEKTHKNAGNKLFNLQLTFKLANKQSIMY